MPPATPPTTAPMLLPPPPLECCAGEFAITMPGDGVAADGPAAEDWLPAGVLAGRVVLGLSSTLVTETSVTFKPAVQRHLTAMAQVAGLRVPKYSQTIEV